MSYFSISQQISIGLNAMTSWQALEEGARRLKIGKSTGDRLAREGDLPAHRMGWVWRFDAEELDAWVKKRPSKDNRPRPRKG